MPTEFTDRIYTAKEWQAAATARTRIERDFDSEAIRQLKAAPALTYISAVPASPPTRSGVKPAVSQ
jgi:hypothetical protein